MTLVELMVVVSIIGALAALAIVGYRRLVMRGKASEAENAVLAMTVGIREFYEKHKGYLDCSTSFDDFYPMKPNAKKHVLNNSSHGAYECWSSYRVKMGPSFVSFAVRAGTKDDAVPATPAITYSQKPTGPWFILVGTTDLDEDGTFGRYVVSSFEPGVIHRLNEGE
jgi:type IV pilus assembly protein PilA